MQAYDHHFASHQSLSVRGVGCLGKRAADQGFSDGFLRNKAVRQGKLALRAHQVVYSAAGKAGGIKAEVALVYDIGCKARRQLDRNAQRSGDKKLALFHRDKLFGTARITAQHRVQQSGVKIRIAAIFAERTAPGTQCITQFKSQPQTGQRIQIEQTDSAALVGKAQVVDLQIAVTDPQRPRHIRRNRVRQREDGIRERKERGRCGVLLRSVFMAARKFRKCLAKSCAPLRTK